MRQAKNLSQRFSWSFLVFFFLVGFLGCASTQVKEDSDKKLAREKFQEAVRSGSLGNNEDMIESLKEAVHYAPQDSHYHLALGRAYFLVRDYDNSEKSLKTAIDLNPQNGDAHRQLGRMYMALGKWDLAVSQFQETLKASSTASLHQIRNLIALSYYNMGKFDTAIAEWKKALEVRDNAAIRLNLALAYRDREHFDKAVDSLARAIALKPNFPQAHYEIALLYLKNKKLEKAERHFKNVIRMEPNGERAAASREYILLMEAEN